MKDIEVNFRDGLWHASTSESEAFGVSPEEAVYNLERLGKVTLARPAEEDWITPDNLPPTSSPLYDR